MRHRLSSHQTILIKFFLPALWIPFFGLGAIQALICCANEPPGWIFPFFWIAGSAFLWFNSARLKYVSVDDEFLYVSNYLREIAIPLSDIYDVTENRWINHNPITIQLKSPSEFGDKIVFMPKVRAFAFFTSHPVVAELKQLARSNQ
jgi:hypothetical protein